MASNDEELNKSEAYFGTDDVNENQNGKERDSNADPQSPMDTREKGRKTTAEEM